MSTPRVLAIAGSDPSGGAGLQADIKAITLLGGYAMSAITAITVQNTRGVQAVEVLPPTLVVAQIRACVADIGVDAVKIGMLGSAAVAEAVADELAGLGVPIVFDPVMLATNKGGSGGVLADAATVAAFAPLIAMATLLTPNLPELAALGGEAALRDATKNLLIKGGHGSGARVEDRLLTPEGARCWAHPRLPTRHTHGTGCTLASAIACELGAGLGLEEAVGRGIGFVQAALVAAPGFGAGGGPIGHFARGNAAQRLEQIVFT